MSPEAHEIIYHDALGYGPTDSGFFFGGFLHDPEELLLVIVIANFIVVAGWGNYFPWAVLALYAELTGKGNLDPVRATCLCSSRGSQAWPGPISGGDGRTKSLAMDAAEILAFCPCLIPFPAFLKLSPSLSG